MAKIISDTYATKDHPIYRQGIVLSSKKSNRAAKTSTQSPQLNKYEDSKIETSQDSKAKGDKNYVTYYEYDGGIAVVLGSDKAFAWDDIDNAWKPVVASEIYGDERAIEVAEGSLAETLDAHEATPYVEASSKNIFFKILSLFKG